jgi:hypothetical protein
MEVHLPYDPLPNGYEEWWNEFSIEPELIYLSQIPFDSLMASTDACSYPSDQISKEEPEQEDSYYTSSKESPSAIVESIPVTPEPELLDPRDTQIDEGEFHTANVQKVLQTSRITKSSLEGSTNANDLVLVLARQFCQAAAAGTEFKLVPASSLIETHSPTLDEATKLEIKNRLAQRKPISKPQPLPDAALHEEVTQLLQEHNILQKSLARTLGIRYEVINKG